MSYMDGWEEVVTPDKALNATPNTAYQYGWRDGFEAGKSAGRIQKHLDAAKECDATYDALTAREATNALLIMSNQKDA